MYAEHEKNYEKYPSLNFRPVGPFDWPETQCKNAKNEKFFKLRTKLFPGSLQNAEYGKNYKKNASQNFRPVGQFDWPETWSKNGQNEKFFKFRTKLLLEAIKYV